MVSAAAAVGARQGCPGWGHSSSLGLLQHHRLPVGTRVASGVGCPLACSGQTLPRTASGGQLKEATGMQHLVPTHSMPWDWCHGNQAGPGTMGIQWVEFLTSPKELRHQAQSWAAGLPLGLFHSSCQVYISLRKENIRPLASDGAGDIRPCGCTPHAHGEHYSTPGPRYLCARNCTAGCAAPSCPAFPAPTEPGTS